MVRHDRPGHWRAALDTAFGALGIPYEIEQRVCSDCHRVLDERTVAYLDLTGSGNETAAHLAENGRITFMFCAFAGAPRILRLYGTGAVRRRGNQRDAMCPAIVPPTAPD